MNTNVSTVGVALGGGGVRGLGHIPVLEAIDACGIIPTAIAGTSMGAIIGVLYAAGRSGKEIRSLVEEHRVRRDDGIKDLYAKRASLLKWLKVVRLSWTGSGLLKADRFLRYLIEQMNVTRFEDLKIPLRVVATDFYTGKAIIFDSGPLLPALKASMSIPGVFVPVEHNGKILVDGGVSNNLPYDILPESCDLTIAVDVSPTREIRDADPPSMIDATLGMFDMLIERVTQAMIDKRPPDIYFHPRLVGIRILDFDKAEDVFTQVQAAIPALTERLNDIRQHSL